MSDVTPTRSAVLEMKDERRAMHDGYVFLDEKCLLLASEILRELKRYAALLAKLVALSRDAASALEAAVARHGLTGVQVYPAADIEATRLVATPRALMGVKLLDASLAIVSGPETPAVDPSPEAQACRRAYAELIAAAAPVAAVAGNLERLRIEYQRSVRRARALQDVLLPELDRDVYEIESRLEELEQEDAIFMRPRATA